MINGPHCKGYTNQDTFDIFLDLWHLFRTVGLLEEVDNIVMTSCIMIILLIKSLPTI